MQILTKDKNSKSTDLDKIIYNTEDKPKTIKKVRKRKIIKLVGIYTISLLIVAFSFTQIMRLQNQKNKTLEITTQIQSYIKVTENLSEDNQEEIIAPKKYTVDFGELQKINPDTKGWIKVNGVAIDFPVVQGEDNKYYLKHSFDKSYNVCGWVFADYRNSFDGTDKNIIIYGHNRRDGTIFSQMTNILKPEWFNNSENNEITFITENEEVKYEVFSIYQVELEDYYLQTNFYSDKEYQDFLNTIKGRSIKDYNIDLTTNDEILTLSTCGNNSKYRIVIHAKKV